MLMRAVVGLIVAVLTWPVLAVTFAAFQTPEPSTLETAELPWFFPVLATWTDARGTPHCRAVVFARLPDLRDQEGQVSLAMPGTHTAACEQSFKSYMASGLWPSALPDEDARWYRRASFSVEGAGTGEQRVTVSYWLDDDTPNESSYTTEGESIRDAEMLSYFGPGLAIMSGLLSAPVSLLLGIGAFFAVSRCVGSRTIAAGASSESPAP